MRLIDADALIMALRLEYPMIPMFKENQEEWGIKTEGYRKAEEVIRNAPTIEPKRGRWKIEVAETIYGKAYLLTCSECGETVSVTETALPYEHFCRNCGARMKGADDE